MNGTLDMEKFKFYIMQDALYLVDFGRALSILAGRCSEPKLIRLLLSFATGIESVEELLHEKYFKLFNIQQRTMEQSPSCLAYTQFLLAKVSLGSIEEAWAALLPCFWIYREVGKYIYQQANTSNSTNPFKDWIDTYAGEEYSDVAQRAIDTTELLAQQSSETSFEKMKEAFIYSSRFEYMFWDSAYKQQWWVI
ncbi:unnamed protein product [Didymodactylos carnosus]|uniref:Thiaminase-2/PQQC domain-containing protein n=1 Tax=Didymodactylos carnosus TaxID=1234261 RepID=A0A814EUW5_9BILA|nr:unnamed protein product [Didymodactylos carnosus]CAF1080062.1 unnamed protein product [Didymodactylos carnosus]CAF3749134.1 unnamed protein product [Didymodactylos carnosus]CAF3843224.1 unnamed protein product [Didymodactylos carnosus]